MNFIQKSGEIYFSQNIRTPQKETQDAIAKQICDLMNGGGCWRVLNPSPATT